jgi:hypothetical protein
MMALSPFVVGLWTLAVPGEVGAAGVPTTGPASVAQDSPPSMTGAPAGLPPVSSTPSAPAPSADDETAADQPGAAAASGETLSDAPSAAPVDADGVASPVSAPETTTEPPRPGSGKRRPHAAVPVLAAAGGAFLGAAAGTGTMLAAVQVSRAGAPPDEATPEVFAGNAALTLGSLGLPVLLAVVGGAAGGGWTWGLEVALTSGFGATVGAAAGAAAGIATASSLSLSADPLLPLAVHGAFVAAAGTLGAALGAIGGVLAVEDE